MRARLAHEAAGLGLALQFLTRLPVPGGAAPALGDMAASLRWYPAVGVLVGAIAALVWWLAVQVLPVLPAAILATAAGILLTGALHEDGLADTADGTGGTTRARALEIMRDSRIGTFGVLALGLVVGAKITALASLPVAAVPLVLIAGHAASRAAMVLAIATGRPARADGAAAAMAGGPGPAGLAVALGCAAAALIACGIVLPWSAVDGGIAGLVLGHVALRLVVERRLGGYTGDTLGAVQQVGEVAFYLGVLACL